MKSVPSSGSGEKGHRRPMVPPEALVLPRERRGRGKKGQPRVQAIEPTSESLVNSRAPQSLVLTAAGKIDRGNRRKRGSQGRRKNICRPAQKPRLGMMGISVPLPSVRNWLPFLGNRLSDGLFACIQKPRQPCFFKKPHVTWLKSEIPQLASRVCFVFWAHYRCCLLTVCS